MTRGSKYHNQCVIKHYLIEFVTPTVNKRSCETLHDHVHSETDCL